jgi:hypothetical protein
VPQALFFDYGLTLVPPVSMARDGLALLVVDMQYHDAAAGVGFCEAVAVYPRILAQVKRRCASLATTPGTCRAGVGVS